MVSTLNRQLTEFQRTTAETEETANYRFTVEYTAPLLAKLFGDSQTSLKVLSVGCGVGRDIDTLIELGYDSWGIDNGYRHVVWHRRQHRERLVVGDGRRLPFEDNLFDAVLSFGVIEHIGQKKPGIIEMLLDFAQQRQEFASELARVTRRGGHIVLSTPNKRCPIDFFHGIDRFGGRLHPPWEDFTLSFSELKHLFVELAGCESISLLPLEGAFSFDRVRQRAWGKLLCRPAQHLFRLVSSGKRNFLSSSFLIPFLMVWVRK